MLKKPNGTALATDWHCPVHRLVTTSPRWSDAPSTVANDYPSVGETASAQAGGVSRSFAPAPEENGDLTDACICTDGTYEWWDESYAIRSFVDTLIERGEVTLPFARSHKHPATLPEAKAYLLQQTYVASIFGGKPHVSFNLGRRGLDLYAAEGTAPYEEFMREISAAGLEYRIHNPIVLAPYTEYADSDVEAPWRLPNDAEIAAGQSPDAPVSTLNEWDEERIMAVAKQVWELETALFEAAQQFAEDFNFEEVDT